VSGARLRDWAYLALSSFMPDSHSGRRVDEGLERKNMEKQETKQQKRENRAGGGISGGAKAAGARGSWRQGQSQHPYQDGVAVRPLAGVRDYRHADGRVRARGSDRHSDRLDERPQGTRRHDELIVGPHFGGPACSGVAG